MIKAGGILKETFDDLTHITCVAHVFHRLSEFIRPKHSTSDRFAALTIKVLMNSNQRNGIFKILTALPLPPQSVTTRWGTWIECILFYAKNFQLLCIYFEEIIVLEDETVDDLIKLKKQELQAELAFISAQFGFSPESIVKLQGRNRLVDSMKLLDNVIEKVQVQPYKGRLDLILGKNPGVQKMREYFQGLSGSIFTLTCLKMLFNFNLHPFYQSKSNVCFQE